MKKILLIFDSYGELTHMEAQLKKVGFDTMGISNEVSINEKVLSFRPDVIVVSGRSQRVSSLSVGQKLKESVKFAGKVILSFPKDQRPSAGEVLKLRLDAIVEYPVDAKTLLQAISQLEGLKADVLLEKLAKSGGTETTSQNSMHVSGSNAGAGNKSVYVQGSSVSDSKRRDRNAEFLASHPESIHITGTTLDKEKTRKAHEDLKKDYNYKDLEELDKLKIEFVKALFKKD